AVIIWESIRPQGTPSIVGMSATVAGSGTATSRRRRRHQEMFAFSAVRTTHAAGAGCVLIVRHEAHARAKASATRSCAASWSPTLTSTVRRHSSLDRREKSAKSNRLVPPPIQRTATARHLPDEISVLGFPVTWTHAEGAARRARRDRQARDATRTQATTPGRHDQNGHYVTSPEPWGLLPVFFLDSGAVRHEHPSGHRLLADLGLPC